MKLNKKQKRTATIASMAALLAVVLGMGGQTFAKYIETQSGKATATVAKFGMVANVQDMSEMFGTTYKAGVINGSATASDASVLGKGLVVAPGTSGAFALTVVGEAEVRTALSVTTTGNTVKCNAYEPIQWSLDNFATDSLTFAELQTELGKLSDESINPQEKINIAKTISWKWELETVTTDSLVDDDIAANKAQNNIYDTVLGTAVYENKIVNTETNFSYKGTTYSVVTEFNFGITVSLTQIQ